MWPARAAGLVFGPHGSHQSRSGSTHHVFAAPAGDITVNIANQLICRKSLNLNVLLLNDS